MAKRKTRTQKENIKHPFLISWDESSEKQKTPTSVKGQNKRSEAEIIHSGTTTKNAVRLDKDGNLSTVRRDVVRSLIVTSLIIGMEVVIYFAWR